MTTETIEAPETAEMPESPNGEAAQPECMGVSNTHTSDSRAPAAALKALSLWQPYATLIAIGAKRIETRSWPTGYRGRVAILATKTTPREDFDRAIANPHIAEALRVAGLDPSGNGLPTGAVLALAELGDSFQFREGFDPGEPERHFGDFSPGRYGFLLTDTLPLPEPIPCRGAQGLFDLPADVAERVLAVLDAQNPRAEAPDPGPERAAPSGAGEAAGRQPLVWRKTEEGFAADNTAGVRNEDGNTCGWYIDRRPDGHGYDVDADWQRLLAAEPEGPFATADRAKAWCEARDEELWHETRGKTTPAPDERTATPAELEAWKREQAKFSQAEPTKVGSDTARGLDAPDPQMWAEIAAAREWEAQAEREVGELGEDLRAAKKRHEAASLRLGRLIDEARSGQRGLFAEPKPAAAEAPKAEGAGTAPEWKPLEWEAADGNRCWFAYSAVPAEGDEDLAWQLDLVDGKGWWPGETPSRLTGVSEVDSKPTFPTLEEGQAWCQAKEDALLAEMAAQKSGQNIPENIPAEYSKSDDAWRYAPISELDLPAGIRERLIDAGLIQLGEIEDWRAGDCADPKVRGFAGANTETRKKLDDAVERYWTEHPRPKAPRANGSGAQTHAEGSGKVEANAGDPDAAERAATASAPVLLADLGLSHDELRRGYYPLLATVEDVRAGQAKTPIDLEHVVTIPKPIPFEPSDRKWIGAIGRDGADYRLLPLLLPDEAEEGDGPYFGLLVRHEGTIYRVGPEQAAIHVKVPEPAPLRPLARRKRQEVAS